MTLMNNPDRRDFLLSISAAMAGLSLTGLGQSQKSEAGAEILGQGTYKWQVVPGWGVLDAETPVNDCHGMIQTQDGRVFLLNNHTKNNVIIYDRSGKLLGKWGTEFPGAHGFTLLVEKGEEFFQLFSNWSYREAVSRAHIANYRVDILTLV